MDSYYNILKGYVANGAYQLADATARIDYGVAAGKITPDQADELLTLAQGAAGGVDVDARLTAILQRLAVLEVEVAALKAAGQEPGGETDPYADVPDWVPSGGAYDAPGIGDKRRYNGYIWVSNIDGNTTVPGSDVRWWTRVAAVGERAEPEPGGEDTGEPVDPDEPTEPVEDEYPDWTPYDGINAAKYGVGSKCTHGGQRYVSTMANNTWEPGVVGWDLVTE